MQIDIAAGKARQHQAGAVLGRQRPAQAQAAGPLAARHHDQPGHRVRQHPDRVRRPGQRPAAGRLRRRRAARRPEPGPAQPPPDGAAPGPGADPGGDRRCRARHRRADHHARLQLRPADEGRGLHPPHRPHRPCRPRRPGRHVRRVPRPPQDLRHRGATAKQPFKAEAIPGLEPQQRAPQARPSGRRLRRPRRRDNHSRDRKFGAPRSGGFGGGGGGFDQRRGDDGYGRKPGFGDFGGAGRGEGFGVRDNDGFAPRGDFAHRRPASFAKPAKPGNGGKVFVPRDIKKRAYKPAN